jgi:predicted helicase
MGRLGDLLTRLDEDNARRGRQFERIYEWFLTNDPLYQRQVRRAWPWDEWPRRRGS